MSTGTLTKQDVIDALSSACDLSKATSKLCVEAIFDFILDEVKKGNKVRTSIGTFVRVDRKARIGRNPSTGEAINIAASSTLSLRVSPKIKVLFADKKKASKK